MKKEPHILNIQRQIGIIFLAGVILGILQNILFLPGNSAISYNSIIFNITTLFCIGIFLVISIIKDNEFFRFIQVFVLITCSFLGLFFNQPGDPTWSIFLIIAIVISFLYGYFEKHFVLKVIIIIIVIIVAHSSRLFIKIGHFSLFIRSISNTIFSTISVIIILYLFKNQMKTYQKYVRRYRKLLKKNQEKVNEYKQLYDNNLINIKLGVNYTGLVHNLDFSRGITRLDILKTQVEKMEIPSNVRSQISKRIQLIYDYFKSKEAVMEKILSANEQTKLTTRSQIDINETLTALFEIYKLDQSLMSTVKIEFLLSPMPINTNCVPFELFMIFDNVIQNSINAILKSSIKNKYIIVKSEIYGNYGIVNISDNGPGFPTEWQNSDYSIDVDKFIKTTTRMGIKYIIDKVKTNNGFVKFNNNKGTDGMTVVLMFLSETRKKNGNKAIHG